MYFTVSSSIRNWGDKLQKRYRYKKYIWWKHFNRPVIFFGFYKPKDWLKFFFHRGEKTIVWCGSDIFQVGLLFRLLQGIKATHICENKIEQGILQLALQRGDIIAKPLCFSNPDDFQICYKPNKNPHVFIHINKKAESESGYYWIESVAPKVPNITFHIYGRMESRKASPNVVFHGFVSEDKFNSDIKNYQGALRLHQFDGFADTVSKSALMGQYPIAAIKYPHIEHAYNSKSLIKCLKSLSKKTKPNYKTRMYYLKKFNQPLV